ncbi:hypothetical protein ABTY20_04955 [Streptomyces sp. NPDC126497]|uniref:hypothetical protein n=1 Tax=Streptomyces sp. NPDC126497 TaxID=3155313 RepID=UPI0033166572
MGREGDPAVSRRVGDGWGDRAVDWLVISPDLPHLIARVSELVLRDGFDPDELVVMPRSEVDRRETAAFSAGWAEAMRTDLPAVRREYERRIADAYAKGQAVGTGARRGGTPLRRSGTSEENADVIPLPFADLLMPPPTVAEAEERIAREQERFDEHRPPSSSELEEELAARERRVARAARRVLGGEVPSPRTPPAGPAPAPAPEEQREQHHRAEDDTAPASAVGTGTAGTQGRGEPRLSERARALVDELQEWVPVAKQDDGR